MSRPNALPGLAAAVRRLVGFSCRHPRKVCAFYLLLAVLAAVILPNLAVNTDTARMLDRTLPFRQSYDAFIQAFPTYDKSFIAVIEAATAEQAKAARDQLAEAFRARSDRFEDVQMPTGGEFLERYGVFLLDESEVARLAAGLPAGEELLRMLNRDTSLSGFAEALGKIATDAPENDPKWAVAGRLLAETAAVIEAARAGEERPLSWRYVIWAEEPLLEIVVVRPELDFASLVPAQEAMAEAQAIAAAVESGFGGAVEIGLTGQTALETEELAAASGGSALAAVLSFIFVSLVLGFGLRSWVLVTASLASLVIGLLLTAGFATLAIGELNLISVAFAVLFIGLSIDFSIHFSLRYQEACRNGDGADSINVCAVELGPALFLCAPTTALAFFSFLFTDFVGMAQLGLISGVGIIIAMLLSLTFLPALLTLLPRPSAVERRRNLLIAGLMAQLSRTPVALTILLAIAASIVFAQRVQFDADTMALRDPDALSVEFFYRLAEDPVTSPYAIQILVPEAEAAELVPRLEALPLVAEVRWRASFQPRDIAEKQAILQSALTSAAWSDRFSFALDLGLSEGEALDETAAIAGELASSGPESIRGRADDLLEALQDFESPPQGQPNAVDRLQSLLFAELPEPLTDLAEDDIGAPEETVSIPDELLRLYQTPDYLLRLEVIPQEGAADPETADAFVDSVKSVVPSATGTLPEIVEAGRVIVRSMLEATAIASVAVILLLFAVFRSPLAVALTLLPVATAALLTLGAMALLGLSFNFANVIVVPLLIGLGIDSGIHLVMRGRQSESLNRTSTPKAVLLSALTTIGSFGTLAVSSHRGTASMGELLALSLFLLLVASLVLLPWVLNRPWLKGRY